MRENEKRLTIEIDKAIHHEIKRRALEKKVTLKSWILLAVIKAMNEEDGK